MDRQQTCKHGSLARSCLLCELTAERDEALVKQANHWHEREVAAYERGREEVIRALVGALHTKTDPRLIDAIIEDVREELARV